jgi:putative chitinase
MLTIALADKLLPIELRSQYGIENKHNLAMFLAQCDYESSGFKHVEENLNYSATGLLTTFHKYFTSESANEYAHKPEMIANHVYANRMGNGDIDTGEGWKYRGRGYIQITGKMQYESCGKTLQLDLVATPNLLCQPQNAILSALWFWDVRDCNSHVSDIEKVTKLINGGLNGINERNSLYKKYLNIL